MPWLWFMPYYPSKSLSDQPSEQLASLDLEMENTNTYICLNNHFQHVFDVRLEHNTYGFPRNPLFGARCSMLNSHFSSLISLSSIYRYHAKKKSNFQTYNNNNSSSYSLQSVVAAIDCNI